MYGIIRIHANCPNLHYLTNRQHASSTKLYLSATLLIRVLQLLQLLAIRT